MTTTQLRMELLLQSLSTRQMRDASHDRHLVMEYSRESLPEHPPEPTPESVARYRKAMEENSCRSGNRDPISQYRATSKLYSFPDNFSVSVDCRLQPWRL